MIFGVFHPNQLKSTHGIALALLGDCIRWSKTFSQSFLSLDLFCSGVYSIESPFSIGHHSCCSRKTFLFEYKNVSLHSFEDTKGSFERIRRFCTILECQSQFAAIRRVSILIENSSDIKADIKKSEIVNWQTEGDKCLLWKVFFRIDS